MKSKVLAAGALSAIALNACAMQQTPGVPAAGTYIAPRRIAPDKRGTVAFYPDTFGTASLDGIVAGPDGALWFTDEGNGIVGRMTTSGSYTLQQVVSPAPSSGITVGPDKRLWFTLSSGVARMTTGGKVKVFSDPQGLFPQGITTGPDGALWYALSDGTVGRITTKGKLTHLTAAPDNAQLKGIVTGPDGNLWITQEMVNRSQLSNQVIRLTPKGDATAFTVGLGPTWICVGRDKALWFTERGANAIGRLTTAGEYTEFPTGYDYGDPSGIALGPDHAVWFSDYIGHFGIGRITVKGKMRFFSVPSVEGEFRQITPGPDGAMWFSSYLNPGIGRIATQ